CDRHPRRSGGGIDQHFDAAPFLRVESWARLRFESTAGVVVARPIVPMASVRYLELNAAKSVQALFPLFRSAAEDKNAGLVIRFSRHVPHGEQKPVLAVVVFRVDNAPTIARAGHGAVLDYPGVGGHLNPTIEGLAIEDRLGLLEHGIGQGKRCLLLRRLRGDRANDRAPAKPHYP